MFIQIPAGEEATIEVKCFATADGVHDVVVDGDGGHFVVPLRWAVI